MTLTSLTELTLADSTTATHELVVPRSIPITFPITWGEHTSGFVSRCVEIGELFSRRPPRAPAPRDKAGARRGNAHQVRIAGVGELARSCARSRRGDQA